MSSLLTVIGAVNAAARSPEDISIVPLTQPHALIAGPAPSHAAVRAQDLQFLIRPTHGL